MHFFSVSYSNDLTGFPASPGLPEKPSSPGRPFVNKKKRNRGYDKTETFRIVRFELYLQEVQGDLGFQVAQVDPEDPTNVVIIDFLKLL